MKKFLSLMLAAVLVLGSALPVLAEKYDGTEPIKHVTGTDADKTSFDKYLVMEKSAQVPKAAFWFEVTAPEPTDDEDDEIYPEVYIAATNDDPADVTPVVWKGVKPEKVQVQVTGYTGTVTNKGELTFGPTDGTTDGPLDNVASSSEKYVKKTIDVSFEGITFAEPGVYRYYLQEQNADTFSNMGILNDEEVEDPGDATWRTLDVYVHDDGNGNLEIVAYVWYEGKLTTADVPQSHIAVDLSALEAVVWTDAEDDTKTYKYENNAWAVYVNGSVTDPLETVETPPATATTATLTIDGTDYTDIKWEDAVEAASAAALAAVPNGAEASSPKSSEFVNKLQSADLEFGKKVDGNQGSRDQWFKFKLTLESDDPTAMTLEPGTEFVVQIGAYTTTNPANAAHFFAPTKNSATEYTVDEMTNANTKKGTTTYNMKADFVVANNPVDAVNKNILVVGDDEKIEWTLYLQHGQYVQILGLPYGVKYTVEETDPATGYTRTDGTDVEEGVIDGETILNKHMDPLQAVIGEKYYVDNTNGTHWLDNTEYKEIIVVGGNKYVTYTDNGDDTDDEAYVAGTHGDLYAMDDNVYTGVTNTRSGVIPTGVLMSVTGGAVLIAAAGTGLFFLSRKRKNEED